MKKNTGKSQVGLRLGAWTDANAPSKASAARDCGVSPSTFAGWYSGSTAPDPDALARFLAKHRGISPRWLLLGEGPERIEPAAEGSAEGEAAYGAQRLTDGQLVDLVRERLSVRPEAIAPVIVVADRKLKGQEPADAFLAVPFLRDAAAAGPGQAMQDEIEGFVAIHSSVCPRPDEICCVRVEGDSMAPVLPDGSIVAVDVAHRDAREADGRIVCARTPDDGVVVKWWHVGARHGMLESQAEGYPAIVLSAEDVDAGALIGVVVWAWVDLR